MDEQTKTTSIVAHIDHGKTTLIDSLIASQGYISKSLAGDLRYLDSRKDEQERGITLKLSPIKLKNNHMFIDTPGHVDFESLVFCSSILADNHMLLIDVNEGITPRTLSLIKFLNKDRVILVLNKIDKCDSVEHIEIIIHQINGLFGEEVFGWSKNNVIISSALLCSGTNFNSFKLAKKSTLKAAYKAFQLLNEKYNQDDVQEIVKKYGIRFKTRKAVFSSVFPLSEAIFDSINSLYNDKQDRGIANVSAKIHEDDRKEPSVEAGLKALSLDTECSPVKRNRTFNYENEFYSINSESEPDVLAITVYGIMKDRSVYEKNNVLFVTKILRGTLRKGDILCENTDDGVCNEVEIEGVYEFSIDGVVELEDSKNNTLVCLAGNFSKNSVISSTPLTFKMNNFLRSFYKSKIVLSDLSQLESMKRTIKTISYTEQCLKAKVNRYREIEISCSGRVQFEKIVHDLEMCNFKFKIDPCKNEFKEFASIQRGLYYKDQSVEFIIKIGPSQNFDEKHIIESPVDFKIIKTSTANDNHTIQSDSPRSRTSENVLENTPLKKIERSGNNILLIKGETNVHIVESVLEIFVSAGPLIKEGILNTFVFVDLIDSTDSRIYNILRNELNNLYLDCKPSVCPRMYDVKVYIGLEYLGLVYTVLQKYEYTMVEEIFDEKTEFYQIECQLPRHSFASFIEEARVKSRGTAYLEVSESNEYGKGDFSNYIYAIRREKGLFVDESVAELVEKSKVSKK